MTAPQAIPDVTSVKTLVTSVTALARHLDVSPTTVKLWIKLDRVPAKHIIRVAQFYDIDLPMHLAQSDIKRASERRLKPRQTLATCLKVQAGELTLAEAAYQLKLHQRAIQLVIKHWGDQLSVLYNTLLELEAGNMTLDQAAAALGVTKSTLHGIRQKFGFQPAPRTATSVKDEKTQSTKVRRGKARDVALGAIAGRYTLDEIDEKFGVSWRTIHRRIAELSPDYGLIKMSAWPQSFRVAYAKELEEGAPQISKKMWEYGVLTSLTLKKDPKYPPLPKDWSKATAREMMLHVLLGSVSLQEVADQRHADPAILESIFTSNLRPLNLTWGEVIGASVLTQAVVGEVLLALEESKITPRMKALARIAAEKESV